MPAKRVPLIFQFNPKDRPTTLNLKAQTIDWIDVLKVQRYTEKTKSRTIRKVLVEYFRGIASIEEALNKEFVRDYAVERGSAMSRLIDAAVETVANWAQLEGTDPQMHTASRVEPEPRPVSNKGDDSTTYRRPLHEGFTIHKPDGTTEEIIPLNKSKSKLPTLEPLTLDFSGVKEPKGADNNE